MDIVRHPAAAGGGGVGLGPLATLLLQAAVRRGPPAIPAPVDTPYPPSDFGGGQEAGRPRFDGTGDPDFWLGCAAGFGLVPLLDFLQALRRVACWFRGVVVAGAVLQQRRGDIKAQYRASRAVAV